MNRLINYARENGFNEGIERGLNAEQIHGIAIGVHPIWATCWQIHLSNPTSNTDFWFDILARLNFFRFRRRNDYYYNSLEFPEIDDSILFDTVMSPMDFGWRPPGWDNIFDFSSVVIKIHVEPGSPRLEFQQRINQMIVVIEYRPVATMAANAKDCIRPLSGGTSIAHSTDASGTLGGILRDKVTGKSYAITCGHVIDATAQSVNQPSLSDNSSASAAIGKSVLRYMPSPIPSKTCKIFSSGTLIEPDIALIELDNTLSSVQEIINIGPISGITCKSFLDPYISVEINGRTSGYKKLVLMDAILKKRMKFRGNYYCFNKIIQLRAKNFLSLLGGRPVSAGDSGAWVCIQGLTGTEWCAMIIAEDRLAGYAIAAEDLMDWLKTNKYHLSL